MGPGGDDSALVELHDVRHLAAEHPELVAVLLDDSHTLLNESPSLAAFAADGSAESDITPGQVSTFRALLAQVSHEGGEATDPPLSTVLAPGVASVWRDPAPQR